MSKNKSKKTGQILIWQQIPKFKNMKLFWLNLKFVFLNLLPKFDSNNEA